MAYYLGIDGGGTKTTCALGDEHSVLAVVDAGPSNITRVGEDRARESLLCCVREASSNVGISPGQITRVCAGVAGAGREPVAGAIRKILGEIIPSGIIVIGDMPIALEAAFADSAGVVVIAGTGSLAYGRNPRGETARAGGWGFAISDEGSAHWIGRKALQESLRSMDERGKVPGMLAEITRTQQCTFDDLIRSANATLDFAALLPPIITMAEGGDFIAESVLASAGTELARLAIAVIGRLFGKGNSEIRVAMAGGVFRHASLVRENFYNEIRNHCQNVQLKAEIVEPVLGALRMARRGH